LVLEEGDAEARVGAQQVLDWLNGNNTLLRAVEVNPADTHDLLVAYEGGTPEAQPETLLRAVEEVAPTDAPSEERGHGGNVSLSEKKNASNPYQFA
jgi:hypothetical protein